MYRFILDHRKEVMRALYEVCVTRPLPQGISPEARRAFEAGYRQGLHAGFSDGVAAGVEATLSLGETQAQLEDALEEGVGGALQKVVAAFSTDQVECV